MSTQTKKPRNLQNEITAHFARRGLKCSLSNAGVERKLRKLLGEARYEIFKITRQEFCRDLRPATDLYDIPTSPQEIHLFMSLQWRELVCNARWITEQIAHVARPNCRIADLGCGAGHLVSWLAHEHADCTVVGIDRVEGFIRCAEDCVREPNASFVLWDYTTAKPADLEPFAVLVSSLGLTDDAEPKSVCLDADTLRRGGQYVSKKASYVAAFSQWRAAATDDARLFAVLNLTSATQFLAVVDAAHECGWTFCPNKFTKRALGRYLLSACEFHADESPVPHEDELLTLWHEEQLANERPDVFSGTTAILVYRTLGDKQILDTWEEQRPDGHVLRTLMGTAGPFAFSFSRTTKGHSWMNLCPLRRIDTLL